VRYFDLNCDLGEERGDDAAVLPHVTSINVACGQHAGGPSVMRATVQAAVAAGVAVGAHPGFADREGFGRRALSLDPGAIFDLCLYQIGALAIFVREAGARLQHVKPHGALYHLAASDLAAAAAIARAVREARADLILVGPPASALTRAAAAEGLRFAGEIFADRSYDDSGQLVPRSDPGAMVAGDDGAVAARAVQLVQTGQVAALSGAIIDRRGQTLCLHGDEPGAPARARAIRAALTLAGVQLRPLGSWL
jgi:5-oxoprolinase (ATP-hydrolysing) subunit A